MITECAKLLETTIKQAKNDLGPDNNPYLPYLAQTITPEEAKLGPDNNFTTYIYIHTHTHIQGVSLE